MAPTSSGGDKLVSVVGVNPPSDIASGRIAEMTRISQQEYRGILEFCKRNSQFIYNNDKKITIYQSKRTHRERKIQKKYSIQRFLRKIKFIQKKLDSYILL